MPLEFCMKICENGSIITSEDVRMVNGKRVVERFNYIGSNDVINVAKRLKEGVPYHLASVKLKLSKDELAFIHVNADRLLNMPEYDGFGWDEYTG